MGKVAALTDGTAMDAWTLDAVDLGVRRTGKITTIGHCPADNPGIFFHFKLSSWSRSSHLAPTLTDLISLVKQD